MIWGSKKIADTLRMSSTISTKLELLSTCYCAKTKAATSFILLKHGADSRRTRFFHLHSFSRDSCSACRITNSHPLKWWKKSWRQRSNPLTCCWWCSSRWYFPSLRWHQRSARSTSATSTVTFTITTKRWTLDTDYIQNRESSTRQDWSISSEVIRSNPIDLMWHLRMS